MPGEPKPCDWQVRAFDHLHPVTTPLSPASEESESHSLVSDSLRPHRLYSPWDSPGQNTGVDSLSLLQGTFPTQGSNPGLPHCRQILYQLSHKGIYTKIYMCVLASLIISHSLRPHGMRPTMFLCPWNSTGQNTGVDSLSLLQGIFPTQGSNPGLLHCRWILYQLTHKGSPKAEEPEIKLLTSIVS